MVSHIRLLFIDVRYALRAARKSLGVTLAIIAMLALGTGGVTTVFIPLYSTLLAPLPFPHPEQLMLIGGNIPIYNHLQNRFEEELDRFFSNLTTYATFPESSCRIPGIETCKSVLETDVGKDFFKTLGVMPLRGNDFSSSNHRQGAVISHRFWRNKMMGDEDVIGKHITVSGFPLTIIGIMPESFDFPAGTDIWRYDGVNGTRQSANRQFLGRLSPELSPVAAAKEIGAIEFKPAAWVGGKDGPLLQSLQTVLYGDRRPILLMLGSTAVLFLVLVCAGVMNILITQGVRRESEMALRLILGATRRNLVFQLLREVLPLIIVGALVGLWLSEISSTWLTARFPALKGGEVHIPVKMAFFAFMVFAVTFIGGLTPALYASGVNLNTYLKSGSDPRRRFLTFSISLRELLVGVQLGLALALLTGVGLLVNSMISHVDVPVRWSSRNIAIVNANFPVIAGAQSHKAARSRALFFQDFQYHLNTIPEVVSATVFQPIPFSDGVKRNRDRGSIVFLTQPLSTSVQEAIWTPVISGIASSEGFEMLGVKLIAGRFFTSKEVDDTTNMHIRLLESRDTTGKLLVGGGVVIINQSLARRFWPGENGVGKTIYNSYYHPYEIVGVVRDFHHSVDDRDFFPAVYYPSDSHGTYSEFFQRTFIVKLHSAALMNDFHRRLSGFDSGSATIETQPLWDIVSGATADMRITLQLLGGFAVLGILIAGLGVYATTSLMASSWKREMGIRMAIGAQTRDILRLVLWRGGRAILFGLPIGLFLAWILSRMLSAYLFQVNTDDSFVWITSCALLLIITAVAVLIPAVRVTRVKPVDALRNE